MKFLFTSLIFIPFLSFSQNKPLIPWIGKPNRIANPGAEANNSGAPLNWKSDYAIGAESNWVSEYGVTSHEWNHGNKKLGIPKNPGNNYFRLTVSREQESRKLNLFQTMNLEDIQVALNSDTVIADFQVWIGSNYTTKTNCSYTEVKVLFSDASGKLLDSIFVKRVPGEFKDLDAGTPEAEERGFNVMHEMQRSAIAKQVPKGTIKAVVKVHCEYPCNKHEREDEEESQGEFSNTFFFDNFSLGFYQK